MNGLTPEERDAVITAIGSVINGSSDKEAFCKCWPTTRRVLQLLQFHVPATLQSALQKIIESGDMICPG